VNQRRSSFAVISLGVHAIVLGALLVIPLFAPLPVPTLAAPRLAWAPERVVQPVDISLPAPARSHLPASSSSAAPERVQTLAIPTPLEAPNGIAPETGREALSTSTIDSVSAIERGGGGSVDGIGITENMPAAPPAAAPQGPQRLHQGIQAPRKTVDVAPSYPALARESHVEGIVILDVIIDETGVVRSTRVLKSVPFLDQSAVDAVQRWRFTPARLNGVAIPIVMTVTVSFRLQ
jgi:periplasmic protein TonB